MADELTGDALVAQFRTDATEFHEMVTADIPALLEQWAEDVATFGAVLGYETRAALYADLEHTNGQMAYVTNDPTLAYNGYYRKTGASGSGSWVQSSGTELQEIQRDFTRLSDSYYGSELYRDGAEDVSWSIRDNEGQVALGVTATGQVLINEIAIDNQDMHRDVQPYLWSISDSSGKVAFGITSTGRVMINDQATHDLYLYRDSRPYLWSISDINGKVALGVTPSGEVRLSPSVELVAAVGAVRYIAPSVFSTDYNCFNIRAIDGAYNSHSV